MANGQGPRTIAGRLGLVEPLTEQRAAYNELMARYAEMGAFSGDNRESKLVPFPSSLRSDITLIGGNAVPTRLEFSFRTDQPNQGMQTIQPTDNRLDINDDFYVTHVRLGFGIYADTAAPGAADVQQWANGAPVAAGGFAAGALAVQRAYNGQMSIECNAVKFMDQLGAELMEWSGDINTGLAVSTVATEGVARTGKKGWPYGWFPLVPGMLFSGRDKTRFALTIPDPLTFVVASNVMFASLQLAGIRVQNGADMH